jgi:hypothetical protein
MTNVEDLRGRLKRLDDLLADPHPGLISWQHLYHLSVMDLLEFWKDEIPTPVKIPDTVPRHERIPDLVFRVMRLILNSFKREH